MGCEGRGGATPSVTATSKLWTCELLVELLPVDQPPSVHLEILDIMTEVGHMLGGECLVWTVG